MRLLDDDHPLGVAELNELYPHTGRGYIIGITGSPGTGKSTLTSQLIRRFREQNQKVGVIAIDPTSPFSGGAILGDRIRMHEHEGDPYVFIRSVATRGNLGGLSRSTRKLITVLDAMGYEIILVETVGVGQDEVDIVGTAHTSIVVLVPGMGDEVQAIKAGILEIADIFVINKADREGADRTERELRMMLELEGAEKRRGFRPPIVRTVAVQGRGLEDLVGAIEVHKKWLEEHGGLKEKMERFREQAFWEVMGDRMEGELRRILVHPPWDHLYRELKEGTISPYELSDRLVGHLFPPVSSRLQG
jgi:LAO/AO transport system kinase